MFFNRRPADAVSVGQQVSLIFRLERETAGDYDFRIIDQNGNLVPINGQKDGITQQPMKKDSTFEATAIFAQPGDYDIEFGPSAPGAATKFRTLTTILVVEPSVTRVALVPADASFSGQKELWTFLGEVATSLRFRSFMTYVADQFPGGVATSGYGALTYHNLNKLSTDFVTEGALADRQTLRNKVVDELSYVKDRQNGLASPFPFTPNAKTPGDYPLDLVPFVELIFVYWMEEAMLFQTLNHIVARFQNRRVGGGHDPLARLSVSPLMPLRGILWGLAAGEQERLSVRRRAAEYQYQYGLELIGRAIPPAEILVERRTQFLQAFHSLLNASYRYYKERDDKTIEADPFPLLSSLQELHLVLARGAHNQFADLPLTARIETINVQWMLAQPEMREFLGGPTMVPYEEPWMDRVDAMKTMQGWSDTSVTHFYDLAFHGEQLLLSVRHGRWNEAIRDRFDAENWAVHWRNSIQRYIHAYRAVTGVDLSERVDTTMPSRLLARRLAQKLTRL